MKVCSCGKSLVCAFSLLGFLQEFLELGGTMVDISSIFSLQKVGCVDGIHGIRVNRDEEAGDGEANEADDDENEGGILNGVSEFRDVLDDEVDHEDC